MRNLSQKPNKGDVMSVQQSIDNISNLAKSLNSMFYERQDEVRIILLALCSKEHVFFLGKAGVAKSLIVEAVANSMDKKYFDVLLGKASKAEDLFGPYSITQLKADKRVRVLDDMLPEADIAFLDECFKANSTVLNKILKVMNERKFKNGSQWVDCPLKTMIGASNELPQDKVLKAMYDRFLFRKEVKSLSKKANFIRLMKEQPDLSKLPKVAYEDFDNVYQAALSVESNDKVLESLWKIKKDLKITSDRRCVKAVKVMKVAAVLAGRTKMSSKDLAVLKYMFWDRPEQIKEVSAKIADNVGSKVRDAVSLSQKLLVNLGINPSLISNFDEAKAAIKKMNTAEHTPLLSETRRKVSHIQAELEAMADEDEECIEIVEQYKDLYSIFQATLTESIYG